MAALTVSWAPMHPEGTAVDALELTGVDAAGVELTDGLGDAGFEAEVDAASEVEPEEDDPAEAGGDIEVDGAGGLLVTFATGRDRLDSAKTVSTSRPTAHIAAATISLRRQ